MRKVYLFLSLLLVAVWATAQVKSEIKITTSKEYGATLDMWPKSTSKEDAISIDWGDGELKEYNIDPNGMPYFTKVSGRIVGDTIRIFTKLVNLECSEGNVTSLTLIDQPLLTNLLVNDNELTSDKCILDGATNLKVVNLSKNQLTIFDMRPFEKLEMFSANDNESLSTVLFADGNSVLRSIDMANCDISHFYPIHLPGLESLNLSNGSLMELELADYYPNLESLNISGNYISEIDIASCSKLSSFNCSENLLKEINVTQNPELLNLFCGGNQIEELNVSNQPKMTNLGCGENLLKSLDVSKLPSLTSLTCDGNQLKRLDLSNNEFLSRLYCKDNQLEFLDFAGNPRLDYVDCRNNANMTACTLNYMFSTMLSRYRDPYSPNLLIAGSNPEHADTEEINSADMKWMTDVKGDGTAVCDSVVITMMPSENGSYRLEQPSLYGKDYKEVTKKAMAGTPVKVVATPDSDYKYESVTVGGETIADTLFVLKEDAAISVNFKSTFVPYITVDVASGTQMSFALRAAEEDTEVSVDWGDGVESAYTVGMGVSRIDGYAAGTTVKIAGAVIEADFTSYPGMGLWDNQLTGIDISHNDGLVSLSTYMNPVQKLTVGNCLDLEYLDCAYCELDELDVTANTKLVTLLCYGNELTKLDVTKCTQLEELSAKNNQLAELNLSGNTKLVSLDVQNNELEQIDVTQMENLESLAINANKIREIDLANNAELRILTVSGNELTSLNLSHNTKLGKLLCADNKLAALDLSHHTGIYYIDCGGNSMTACALNDLYYGLPEYPELEEPVKGFTLWVKGSDEGTCNDAEHAESLIATGKGWRINYEGDGTGCNEAYITVKEPVNGKIQLMDSNNKEVVSGGKVAKNTVVTVITEPDEGYQVESVKANGKEVVENAFTVLRATDVVAKFTILSGIDMNEKEAITVIGGKNNITFDASAQAEIGIYSMDGVQIQKKTISDNERIDLPAGMYVVTVKTGQANVSKVVVVY